MIGIEIVFKIYSRPHRLYELFCMFSVFVLRFALVNLVCNSSKEFRNKKGDKLIFQQIIISNLQKFNFEQLSFNPVHTGGQFLYHLKIKKTWRFSVFRGV